MAGILVIEDDENINELLCNILKQNGYEVESTLNGWEGCIYHDWSGDEKRIFI